MTNIYTRLADAMEEFVQNDGDIEKLLVIADVDTIINLSQTCDALLDKVEEKYGDQIEEPWDTE